MGRVRSSSSSSRVGRAGHPIIGGSGLGFSSPHNVSLSKIVDSNAPDGQDSSECLCALLNEI